MVCVGSLDVHNSRCIRCFRKRTMLLFHQKMFGLHLLWRWRLRRDARVLELIITRPKSYKWGSVVSGFIFLFWVFFSGFIFFHGFGAFRYKFYRGTKNRALLRLMLKNIKLRHGIPLPWGNIRMTRALKKRPPTDKIKKRAKMCGSKARSSLANCSLGPCLGRHKARL